MATSTASLIAQPSEPVVPVVPVAQQPIFVQAPEAPRPRGNRGAAGAIGLLAAVGRDRVLVHPRPRLAVLPLRAVRAVADHRKDALRVLL